MTRRPGAPISEDDLHAYRDGVLEPHRMAELERYLLDHPEVADQIERWRRHETELAAVLGEYRFGSADDIPLSGPRQAPRSSPRWMAMAAAIVLAFGLGGGAGYLGRGALDRAPVSGDIEAIWLEAAARDVFLTYVGEVRHPVEVGADEREHLTNWLGNRIERPFTAPSLADQGFMLVGGRLLPINGRPGAMLMYENGEGDRATILLARNPGARDTAFQFSNDDGVNIFRWIDGPLAYAISGFLDRGALEDITRAVYDHFEAI